MATATAHHENSNYLNHEKGLWSWLSTLDHKRIGLLYFITVSLFFLVGGIFALLIRTELYSVGETIMTAEQYARAMTYHGAVMVFLVIIPGIPAFLGNFFLPLQIGAKDVAFPRLNLLSWYCLLLGAGIQKASTRVGHSIRRIQLNIHLLSSVWHLVCL